MKSKSVKYIRNMSVWRRKGLTLTGSSYVYWFSFSAGTSMRLLSFSSATCLKIQRVSAVDHKLWMIHNSTILQPVSLLIPASVVKLLTFDPTALYLSVLPGECLCHKQQQWWMVKPQGRVHPGRMAPCLLGTASAPRGGKAPLQVWWKEQNQVRRLCLLPPADTFHLH